MSSIQRLTPMKVIRAKCLECSAGSSHEVKYCPVSQCPLWEWRFGHRPETTKAKTPNLVNPDWVLAEGKRLSEKNQGVDRD